jgi:alcohol dehydrogenase YqhD (iron-dependent ADH family)
MGLPVRLSELAPHKVSADDVVEHLERARQTELGEAGDIGGPQVREIITHAA